MQKTIEVVYEKGVFKPLEKVELEEGGRVKVTIERERGIITLEDIKELKESIKTLPKSKIRLKRIDEIYYEGKMLD
jgi:predicted DNA-binding antitoxin AbrB/MazE fold protein